MRETDKTIPITCDEVLLHKLAAEIKAIFPNNKCYFIGSICHDNIGKSDIDFLVLTDKAITVTKLRRRREQVKTIDPRLQMMICFSDDQTDLKEIPYISMQDIQDRKIINRNDFDDSAYSSLKEDLYSHLWKKRKYNKAIVRNPDRKEIREKTITEKKGVLSKP